MKHIFLLITAVLLSVNLTNAQITKPDTATYRIPFEVIVSATKILTPLKNLPFAATIINREMMSPTLNKTIAPDEALKLTPGVKIDNQADGNRVHLSMRGQGILSEHGIRGIKFLLDGIPLNDPSGFAPDLFDVDWATIKNI